MKKKGEYNFLLLLGNFVFLKNRKVNKFFASIIQWQFSLSAIMKI